MIVIKSFHEFKTLGEIKAFMLHSKYGDIPLRFADPECDEVNMVISLVWLNVSSMKDCSITIPDCALLGTINIFHEENNKY